MAKLTAREQKLFAQHQIEREENNIFVAGMAEESTTFSCKVDSYFLENFKKEIEKYNENNPQKKLKMKNLMDKIFRDYTRTLKILNEKHDQQELF